MSPEKAFNVVINAAVAHWAADTKRYETARSFRPHSETARRERHVSRAGRRVAEVASHWSAVPMTPAIIAFVLITGFTALTARSPPLSLPALPTRTSVTSSPSR
jgi:hypothetical protein